MKICILQYIKFFLSLHSFLFFLVAKAHVIVFIHIGAALPIYLYDAIEQAKLFNSKDKIYLIASQQALSKGDKTKLNINLVLLENLIQNATHKAFTQQVTLDKGFREGFWLYTSERFLYLNDFMEQFDISDVIHVENDNLLYLNVEEILPVLKKNYLGIAAVFDHNDRCIPSFVYIANKTAMKNLAQFFLDNSKTGKNDMQVIAAFRNQYSAESINNLPIIMQSYFSKHILNYVVCDDCLMYSRYIEQFGSIFDGAALGQYLGGIDPRNGLSKPGFINETCVFDPSKLTFKWVEDQQGRKIPYIMLNNNESYRINNLHIHSKNLKPFMSKPSAGKKYIAMEDFIDVVFVCHPKDRKTLGVAINGIRNNGENIRRIIVVSAEQLTNQAEWFNEANYPFTKIQIAQEIFKENQEELTSLLLPQSRLGWIYQQLLKLYAPLIIPKISSNVLIIDADTIFLNYTSFIDKNNCPLYNYADQYYEPYFQHAQRLIPGFTRIFNEYSGISHHMLFQKLVIEDLFQTIKNIHNEEPWRAICHCIDHKYIKKSTMSEYEIYFNFVFSQNKSPKIRKLKWQEMEFNFENLDKLKADGYNYVSCHGWLKS